MTHGGRQLGQRAGADAISGFSRHFWKPTFRDGFPFSHSISSRRAPSGFTGRWPISLKGYIRIDGRLIDSMDSSRT